MTLVELKTEATIARAELDGAYGSRAERAADMAAVRSNTELTRLQAQVDTLRSELSETVKELEEMTKETIGSEREKVDLEGKLDDVLIVKTSLEAELNQLRERLDTESQRAREKITKLQEELDSERLKAVPGQGAAARPSAGASMLSEQFRATMREERKKFQEDIRVSRLSVATCMIDFLLIHDIGGACQDSQTGRGAQQIKASPRTGQESTQSSVTTKPWTSARLRSTNNHSDLTLMYDYPICTFMYFSWRNMKGRACSSLPKWNWTGEGLGVFPICLFTCLFFFLGAGLEIYYTRCLSGLKGSHIIDDDFES
jgi:cell division protein ZapA (FtsZ GTPase activity inhibitor)